MLEHTFFKWSPKLLGQVIQDANRFYAPRRTQVHQHAEPRFNTETLQQPFQTQLSDARDYRDDDRADRHQTVVTGREAAELPGA